MGKIIPAILSNDVDEVGNLLKRCEEIVDRVQLDIIDGKFANNKTIDPVALSDFETDLKIDYHLMVDEPIKWVEKCLRSSADRIIGHVEKMGSIEEFIQKCSSVGVGVGLAIDLETDTNFISEHLLKDVDVILLMGVKAGFGGQKFEDNVFEKIEEVLEIRKNNEDSFIVQVDGGIKPEVYRKIKEMGVDEVCVGRSIFEGDLKENIENFNGR